MGNLYRSSDENMIAGVCAGIAHKLDLNLMGLRWAVVGLTLLLSGLPVLVYLMLWLVLKTQPTKDVIDI